MRGRPHHGAAGSISFGTGRKYQVITVDAVPIFGAEAPRTAAVEVGVEASNPATTTALVVSSIVMDSGVSIFASQKGFSSTGKGNRKCEKRHWSFVPSPRKPIGIFGGKIDLALAGRWLGSYTWNITV